jgi:hypothetical protein
MQMLRYFFDAASEIDPAGAREHDEALLFPICRPDRLEELFASSGLNGVQARAIDVETRFANFDDFWTPFLSGGAPAPKYLLSLPEERRAALRELLRTRLPAAGDGTITLIARAWAVKGTGSRD